MFKFTTRMFFMRMRIFRSHHNTTCWSIILSWIVSMSHVSILSVVSYEHRIGRDMNARTLAIGGHACNDTRVFKKKGEGLFLPSPSASFTLIYTLNQLHYKSSF